jgi:hypothetical protein
MRGFTASMKASESVSAGERQRASNANGATVEACPRCG